MAETFKSSYIKFIKIQNFKESFDKNGKNNQHGIRLVFKSGKKKFR